MTNGLRGNLDRLEAPLVEGWAVDPDCEEDCGHVDVIVDGILVTTLRANLFRGDLQQEGIRAGYARFSFQLPKRFGDGCAHTIDVRHSGTGRSLENSPSTFTFGKDAKTRAAERRTWAIQELVLKSEIDVPAFRTALKQRRKVALVSTFHKQKTFMQYHQVLFSSLVEAGFIVVAVHAAADPARGAAVTIGRRNCFTIAKTNVGYDFGSWAIGVFSLGEMMSGLDELLLLNDSVIEISRDGIRQMIARARTSGKDIVGITDSYERTYHLQSYFLWFGRKACRSGALQAFMAEYSFSSDKETVIEEGELTLTARMLAEGFSIGCLHPYERVARAWMDGIDTVIHEIRALPDFCAKLISAAAPTTHDPGSAYKDQLCNRVAEIFAMVLNGTPVNPTHFFWDALIADGFPLIKRELVTVNPVQVPTLYRLGRILTSASVAEAAILDLRRRYGGQLVPIFWRPSERSLARASFAAAAAHPLDQVMTFGGLEPPAHPLGH